MGEKRYFGYCVAERRKPDGGADIQLTHCGGLYGEADKARGHLVAETLALYPQHGVRMAHVEEIVEPRIPELERRLAIAVGALRAIASEPIHRCTGYSRCADSFVSGSVVEIASDAVEKCSE